jgi:hypothetical protein
VNHPFSAWAGTLTLVLVVAGASTLPAQAPAKAEGVTVTAKVAGYTQATMFNQQKYPFKYTGTSNLTTEQVEGLARAGAVPDKLARALLKCLLWAKAEDALDKVTLKSGGKKLSGTAEVVRKYGKEGTHRLKFKLAGEVADGRLTLRAVEATVSGTWDWGGGSVALRGEVTATFVIEPHK